MVWAAIGPGFRSHLQFCENSVGYIEYGRILHRSGVFDQADEFYGKGSYIFQQDGAPAHTARKTISWLRRKTRLLRHWPANSPDLNVIENIWGIMKAGVRVENPKTTDELKAVLTQIWDLITQSTIDKLCNSFRYRLNLVVLHNGEAIGPYLRNGHNEENFVLPDAYCETRYEDLVAELIDDGNIPMLEFQLPPRAQMPFTEEEDIQLSTYYMRFGPKWDRIGVLMQRPGNELKNRWNSCLSRRVRLSIHY